MLATLFRKKSLDQILHDAENQTHKLKKSLSAADLVMFGVGAMIGAGIFALTGAAAVGGHGHLGAGPALTLSFVLTGIVCAFCAICYSEFAAMAPISGSAYTYAFTVMGELTAWIIGWALVLEYAVGNMAVAVSWTGNVKLFLAKWMGIVLPSNVIANTFDTVTSLAQVDKSILLQAIPFNLGGEQQYLLVQKAFNLPAALIVLAASALLYKGVQESAKTAAAMVVVKTSVILLFIAVGGAWLLGGHMDVLQHNWFADGLKTFMPNGMPGIIAGASTVFFAYIGFDAVSTAAEETKNPQRDIPIGIIGSLAICTVLYILVTTIITGIVPLNQIDKEAAVAHAMSMIGYQWAFAAINIGAIAGLTSVLLVLQMGGIRIFYAIARDGLLPKALASIHPKFQTPHICTVLVGSFVALGAGLLPINLLAEMCNIGTLGAFMVVCLGVALLRFTDPDRHRPFRAPLGITFPILGMAGCAYIMSGLPMTTWIVTGVWFLIGIVLYFSYGYWNSNLSKKNQLAATANTAEKPMQLV
jgi:basic amino acid/polyamine antiporter, APA family